MNREQFLQPVEQMFHAMDNFPIENQQIYANYLAQTFYYVSHSTRLLAFAAGLMSRENEPHFRRFIRHIAEESAHEVLAEKDLFDLGLSPQEFLHLPETRSLWEPQYYKILHENPISFMGYIIALEHFACSYLPKIMPTLEKTYGGKACRFIKLHAEEDPDHIEKALKLTETLTSKEQDFIYVNLAQTAKTYAEMVRACEKYVNVDSVATLYHWTPEFSQSNPEMPI